MVFHYFRARDREEGGERIRRKRRKLYSEGEEGGTMVRVIRSELCTYELTLRVVAYA